MINKYSYQTLHSHTKDSDGLLTHREVLNICSKYNIGVVAFTDHDTLPNEKTLKLLKKEKKHPTKWIVGIEISSGWPLDLGGGATSGLHVVGLFVDPFNRELLDHCTKAKEARITRMRMMVKNLVSLGFKITEKDCLRSSVGETVGRPHIVTALSYYPENSKVYDVLRKRMKNDSKNDQDIKRKYEDMILRGDSQYPYVLFLSDDSYIKNIYVDYQYYSDFDSTVSLIRNAGGLAILAHWGSCRFKMTDEYMDGIFKKNSIDGAETVYGLWNYESGKWTEQEKELKILKKLVGQHDKLHSGGADAHTRKDFEQFVNEQWFSERTVGLIENIIKKSNVDTVWSSLGITNIK